MSTVIEPGDMDTLRACLRRLASGGLALSEVVEMLRTAYCEEAVALCDGNQKRATKQIKTHRNTLARNLLPSDERITRKADQVMRKMVREREINEPRTRG